MNRPNLCAEVFLKEQGKLFDEPVASNITEAIEFLEDSFAQEFKNIKQVREYLDELGMDTSGLADNELEDELEVFKLPDGTYFVVEA
jgi:hypothetical protein